MWKKIDPKQIEKNVFSLIGDQWMLVTAGKGEDCNTMTASWGGLGVLWGKCCATAYIRPQRYTKEFVDREPLYTLCFFSEEHKKALGYLGRNSGRDGNKVAAAGLTPVFGDGYTYFSEADLVLVCRKLYRAPVIEAGFLDKALMDDCYPNRDFHDMYIGEITKEIGRAHV